jgi:hypothetical protein
MAKSKRRRPRYGQSVFINCPFDPQYRPLFQALIFAIEDCGFVARCALEVEDSGEVRVNKIIKIIKGCALGIHDISRIELNDESLPRFNMPYELGLFIGCSVFGAGARKVKKALILDSERYRFAKFISDIAGQDIQDHGNDPAQVIRKVRNWLASHADGASVPGGDTILHRFNEFRADLGDICAKLQLSQTDLENFRDFHNCITEWLIANARPTVPT